MSERMSPVSRFLIGKDGRERRERRKAALLEEEKIEERRKRIVLSAEGEKIASDVVLAMPILES